MAKHFVNKLRDALITFQVHRLALPLVKHITKPVKVPFALQKLAAFPEGSLGRDLFLFLEKHDLQLLPHFETHDVKHVLLGYGIGGKDEGCMQFFYVGNRHYSPASLMTVAVSLLLMPEHIRDFIKAFRRGRSVPAIGKLPLETMLHEPTFSLREKFQIV